MYDCGLNLLALLFIKQFYIIINFKTTYANTHLYHGPSEFISFIVIRNASSAHFIAFLKIVSNNLNHFKCQN